MKKYYSARSISPAKKVLLIERAIAGVPVSAICKEEAISRTIFYRWIKEINLQGLNEGPGILRADKKRTPRTISTRVERNVVNRAIRRPRDTLRQYASHAGISTRAVWLILKSKGLSSREERENYFLSHGNRVYKPPSHEAKVSLLKRAERGESVSKLCTEAGVSRTIFYKWLCHYKEAGNQYEALRSKRPSGEKHYRHIEGLEEAIIAVIFKHPEYSLSRILSCLTDEERKGLPAAWQAVSRSGIYKVLKRFGLTTAEKRFAYLVRMKARNSIPKARAEESIPGVPRYSFVSYLDPPLRDLTLLLHCLFFEVLHHELLTAYNCDICSFISGEVLDDA